MEKRKFFSKYILRSFVLALVLTAIISLVDPMQVSFFSEDLIKIFVLCLLASSFVTFGFMIDEKGHTLDRIDSAIPSLIQKHGKKMAVAFSLLLVLLFLLQLNNSSMECYNRTIPNNIDAVGSISIGVARPIRSDEYLGLADSFYRDTVGDLRLLWAEADSVPEYLNNVICMLNPFRWGELYFSESFRISWDFLFKCCFSLWVFFRLFMILTQHAAVSAAAAFILMFSPGFQWWWGPIGAARICAMVVLFYDFFHTDSRWKKALYAYGLICVSQEIIRGVYPAWDVPLVYLFALVLLALWLENKESFTFRKSDLIYVGVVCAVMALFCADYFIVQSKSVEAQLSTVYPGKRFCSGGGLPKGYLAYYLSEFVAPFHGDAIVGTNQCEASSFLSLFPLPLLVFFTRFKTLRKKRILWVLFAFNVFSVVYMFAGIGDTAAKYTLLSYTTESRLSYVWELCLSLMLLLECFYLRQGGDAPRTGALSFAVTNAGMLAFLLWVGLTQTDIVNYIGIPCFVLIFAVVLLLTNLMLLGKPRLFLLEMCFVTLLTGATINPIRFGAGEITDTPVAEAIRKIDTADSGRWIALDDIVLPKYVYAQGADCLNHLSWPPRFDLFEPLDADGEYRDVYNRYAHVQIELTDEETSFELLYPDHFLLHMNTDDLAQWNVKYVVVKSDELTGSDRVRFSLVYHDPLDDVNIYEVLY